MKKHCLLLLLLFTAPLFAQNSSSDNPQKEGFHFNSYKLNKESQISAARLNHPITEKDRIIVSKDGHLEVDGKRIRIWGTNLSEFPTSHSQADFFAAALADQGYNCIRFHHTDADWSNCFLKKLESGKCVINNKRLDDFDYFFMKLKENGIYTNINFLTGRSMSSKDGYKPEIDSYSDWKIPHLLGFWDEDALKKQQEYASTLMEHVNPYTGIAYKDDPAVAIVEINNENGLLMGYTNHWLDEVTGEYWTELEEKWNKWLSAKGYTFENLSKKFNRNAPVTKEFITDITNGNLEQHQGAKATLKKTEKQISIKIEKNGSESWHIQYNYPKLSMSSDKIYTIKFSAKASKNAEIYVSLMQAHDPWQGAGFDSHINLKNKWTDFEFQTEGVMTDDNLRLNFGSMGKSAGTTFTFKNISILEGGNLTYVTRSKNKPDFIALPHYNEFSTMPEEYKTLIMNFLWDTEEAYWLTMIDHVRNTIKSDALIMGTAAGCSTAYLQSNFDIIDSHAYWNHPYFPEKSWDISNYYVNNKDLTKAGKDNTLTSLAKYRVYGKPFSVSEYDHPYPNQFLSQDYPMISAFGAFQDWDCIFTFASEIPRKKDGQNTKINRYFDQSNNPAKACASPVAARIFRQGLITPAPTKVSVPLTKKQEIESLYKMQAWSLGNPELFGSIPQVALKYQLGLNLEGVTSENLLPSLTDISKINKSEFNEHYEGFDETEQFYWNQTSGTFIICNPDVSISIMSKNSTYPAYPDNWLKCKLLPAKPTSKSDFITVVAVRDIQEVEKPYLIFSCSWVGNTKDNVHEYGTKFEAPRIFREHVHLTTHSTLGAAPVLALSSDAYLYITSKEPGTLYKTNLNGNKDSEVSVKASQEFWSYQINRNDNTLWYILNIQ